MGYTIELSVDTRQIEACCNTIPAVTDQALYKAINEAGNDLYKSVIGDIAGRLEVRLDYVDQALSRRAGNITMPVYKISSVPSRFPVVRWVTQRDEKVCKICGPRDGKLFTTTEIRYTLPAHPNCRCFTEDVDIGGELMASGAKYLPIAAQQVLDKVMKAVKSTSVTSGGSV